ncbi:hypothetical protein BUALT_Bualt03G0169200 [Buddleja alternifolia]|uniref:Pentatricopeptide repeat-containing protein n=1 Tax=Buddleja alternifolia TaxID=168488 RepID=A0AAV6Y113_9LAMI|nr:hypothetical protein BUALT_Bualt03G0169200 [Buddleja alternifolia]
MNVMFLELQKIRFLLNTFGVKNKMKLSGMLPDSFSFGSLLRASAGSNGLRKVDTFHGHIIQFGFGSHKFLSGSLVAYVKCGSMPSANQLRVAMDNAMVDMDSKSGVIEDAKRVFHKMEEKKWTSLITGCGKHGCSMKQLQYEKIENEGFEPNGVTILSLLVACSHNGLFEEAYVLVCQMPTDPDASILGAILGACSTHFESLLYNPSPRVTLIQSVTYLDIKRQILISSDIDEEDLTLLVSDVIKFDGIWDLSCFNTPIPRDLVELITSLPLPIHPLWTIWLSRNNFIYRNKPEHTKDIVLAVKH